MKVNKKKVAIYKANCIVSNRNYNTEEIPIEDKDNINIYLNNNSLNIKKPKLKNINNKIKNIVETYLKDYKDNFDSYYKKFTYYTKDNYIIKYNISNWTKDYINLKCADIKCGVLAKLYIYNEKHLAFPDDEGNIIKEETINKKFMSEEHKIPEKFHKSYIKDYIYKNFSNLTKKEIFNTDKEDLYLHEYCRQFFLNNPDTSTFDALNELAKKFKTDYNQEIEKLYKSIKIGKQYQYDNKILLKDYIPIIH